MNWQPIETAPKGKRILLWYGHSDYTDGNCVGGHWDDDRYAKKPVPYWTNDMERLWGRVYCRKVAPTHWCEITPPTEPQP